VPLRARALTVPAHLIHVGFPKTGSTFLQRWFEEHPEMKFDRNGIAGYRDVWDIARQSADPDPRMRCRVTSDESLIMPSRTAGLEPIHPEENAPTRDSLLESCSTLASLFPGAKVLIVTRGFKSLMMSGYSQYVRSGGNMDMETMFRRSGEIGLRWHYDFVVGLYEAAFPGNVLVLPYELLRDDPLRFLNLVEGCLGLGHHPPPPERVNASLSPAELRWYPRLTRLLQRLPVQGRARRAVLLPYIRLIRRGRLAGLARLLQRVRPAPPIGPELIPDGVLALFAGRAERLRANSLYAPYAADYLW
jgi:hypothetical protein